MVISQTTILLHIYSGIQNINSRYVINDKHNNNLIIWFPLPPHTRQYVSAKRRTNYWTLITFKVLRYIKSSDITIKYIYFFFFLRITFHQTPCSDLPVCSVFSERISDLVGALSNDFHCSFLIIDGKNKLRTFTAIVVSLFLLHLS